MDGKQVVTWLAVVLLGVGVAMAQTEWVEDPSNPIIGPGEPGEWDDGGRWPSDVVFDGSIYHMWYEGLEEDVGSRGIGHATSTDGYVPRITL